MDSTAILTQLKNWKLGGQSKETNNTLIMLLFICIYLFVHIYLLCIYKRIYIKIYKIYVYLYICIYSWCKGNRERYVADTHKLGTREKNIRGIQDTLKVSTIFIIRSQEREEKGNRARILYGKIKADNFQKLVVIH